MSTHKETSRARRLAEHLRLTFGFELKHTQAITALAIADGERNRHTTKPPLRLVTTASPPDAALEPTLVSNYPAFSTNDLQVGSVVLHAGRFGVAKGLVIYTENDVRIHRVSITNLDETLSAADPADITILPGPDAQPILTWCHPLPDGTVLVSVPVQRDNDGADRATEPAEIGFIAGSRPSTKQGWIYEVIFPKSRVSVYLDELNELTTPAEADRQGIYVLALGPTLAIDHRQAPSAGAIVRHRDTSYRVTEILPQQPNPERWRVLNEHGELIEVERGPDGWEMFVDDTPVGIRRPSPAAHVHVYNGRTFKMSLFLGTVSVETPGQDPASFSLKDLFGFSPTSTLKIESIETFLLDKICDAYTRH